MYKMNQAALMQMYAPFILNKQSRRNFTIEEDKRLIQLVNQIGEENWDLVSRYMPGRNIRQCKERWGTYLNPRVNKAPWTPEEDELLIRKFKEIGPRWVEMGKYFVGRSDNNIKNRWYSHLKKRIEDIQEQEIESPVPSYIEEPRESKKILTQEDCIYESIIDGLSFDSDWDLGVTQLGSFEFVC